MRDTTSYHIESLKYKANGLGAPVSPTLNLRDLGRFIQQNHDDNTDASVLEPGSPETGKKRSRSTSSGHNQGKKRLKTSSGASVPIDTSMDADNPYPTPQVIGYPCLLDLRAQGSNGEIQSHPVPVFHHVFEIHYTSNHQSDGRAVWGQAEEKAAVWQRAEEDWFVNELWSKFGNDVEPRAIELGGVSLSQHRHRAVVRSERLCEIETRNPSGWLAALPDYDPDRVQKDDLDLPLDSWDLLRAIATLCERGRVTIDGFAKLIVLPMGGLDSLSQLPFTLQIDITVSILTPHIFEPPGYRDKTGEDAQRRFLHFLYPPPPPPASFKGVNNVPFFYSVMKPAPELSSHEAEEAMQPLNLLPTLLPFQRRTVGWLLEREGMTISADGTIRPSESPKGFNFWHPVEEENHTWYHNRLTGELSPDLPDAEPVYGGILAEEPGLGKTVETIALVSLNPAPPDRNPSVTRWDDGAEVDVKAVKATLIVTPLALQSQWIDELKAHAPHLKVHVYEGWSKISVPITAAQVEEAQQKRAQTKRKAEKKAARAATKAEAESRIKSKGKRRANNEEDAEPGPSRLGDADEEDEIVDWYAFAHSFDIVITTYKVFQNDLNVARAPPKRPRRDGVHYENVERPRSPLVMCEWYRVIMDEVQMAGGGKTEDMVSLIPRRISFAVSGTPARTQVTDLIHVLKFLRVDEVTGPNRVWYRLQRRGYAREFADFFRHYSVRTVKKAVSQELTIPQQTRYLVSIDMGRVERHVYDQALEASLVDLGLDARGVAASEGWEVDGLKLRQHIRRLRAICTHPQVGQLANPNDKLYKPGALKSMADVLEMMKEQNWRNLMEDCKSKVQAHIKIAQLQMLDAAARNRFQAVIDTLTAAEKDGVKLMEDVEAALAKHREKGELLKKEAAAQRALRAQAQSHQAGAKGKGREVSPLSEDEDEFGDEDDEEDDGEEDDAALPRTPEGKEYKVKRTALKQRLREGRFVLHRIKLLQGDAYHNLGPSFTNQETAAYESAEQIRKTLLKTTEERAKKGMQQLVKDATSTGVDEEELTIPVPYLEQGGIRSAESIEQLHEIIETVLNEQTSLIWEWRGEIYNILTQKLNVGDEDVDGQEYERNLNNQGKAETYITAYSALLADRREALMNERTLLAQHDVRETKARHTKAAQNAAASAEAVDLPAEALEEMRAEDIVLLKQLTDKRKELLMDLDGRAVKTILVELTSAVSRIQRDDDPEKILLKAAVTALRRLIQVQQSKMDKMDADLAMFRRAFNQRVLYFRQLQEISDSVAEVEYEGTREEALEETRKEIADLENKVKTNHARQRYLENLASREEEDEDENCCILCRCEFERGFITTCAHVFCEGCMKAWTQRKEGKSCPVCRVPIAPDTLQRFTLSGGPPPPKIVNVNGEIVPRSRRKIEYNMIDQNLFNEIQKIDAFGDFGNKIQSLVRHLLYLQQNEPGSKSIVFSAWADSLMIIQRALDENGIGSIRIDRGAGSVKGGGGPVKKFKTNPDLLVLLLHGERENAGLNITCASRVFLLESVVHHGFEVQAIARIDRMGQTRPTEVYCYYAEETVERNILDLAARQGLSLYTKDNAKGSLNSTFGNKIEKEVIEAPKKNAGKNQKGDFIQKTDDMLAVLFPHMYEDPEYLIDSEDQDAVMEDMTNVADHQSPRRTMNKQQHVNAAAGRGSRGTRRAQIWLQLTTMTPFVANRGHQFIAVGIEGVGGTHVVRPLATHGFLGTLGRNNVDAPQAEYVAVLNLV
ncbi:hypothetical protein PQX77_005198 [Marasmius sp. AFHP31]|nr:hypothetical protein PQX77_005198 [Marasmius sp. AFHP31]